MNNDGKKGQFTSSKNDKLTVKYTLERTKEDIENLQKVKRQFGINTDAKLYRELPKIYLNAVKKNQDLTKALDELTAKLDQLEILRTSLCRIFEICKEE